MVCASAWAFASTLATWPSRPSPTGRPSDAHRRLRRRGRDAGLFDHVGAGQSAISAYDKRKYSSLAGYADDVLEICRELGLSEVIFVGHSVSAMVGVLASAREPSRFSGLVLVGLGLFFLAREWLPQFDFDWFWPLVLVGIGVVLLVSAVGRGPREPGNGS